MKFLAELMKKFYDGWTMRFVRLNGKLSNQEIAELRKLINAIKDKS